MRWDVPRYSSLGSTFNEDMGATVDGEENHVLSVFLRDGDTVWRTYFTEDTRLAAGPCLRLAPTTRRVLTSNADRPASSGRPRVVVVA